MVHVARALIVTALEMIEFLRIVAAAANNGYVFVIVYQTCKCKYVLSRTNPIAPCLGIMILH